MIIRTRRKINEYCFLQLQSNKHFFCMVTSIQNYARDFPWKTTITLGKPEKQNLRQSVYTRKVQRTQMLKKKTVAYNLIILGLVRRRQALGLFELQIYIL